MWDGDGVRHAHGLLGILAIGSIDSQSNTANDLPGSIISGSNLGLEIPALPFRLIVDLISFQGLAVCLDGLKFGGFCLVELVKRLADSFIWT